MWIWIMFLRRQPVDSVPCSLHIDMDVPSQYDKANCPGPKYMHGQSQPNTIIGSHVFQNHNEFRHERLESLVT